MTPTPGVSYTVANSPQKIPVVNDLSGKAQVTYCGGKFIKSPSPEDIARCNMEVQTPADRNAGATYENPALYCKPSELASFDRTVGQRSDHCPTLCYDYEKDSNI